MEEYAVRYTLQQFPTEDDATDGCVEAFSTDGGWQTTNWEDVVKYHDYFVAWTRALPLPDLALIRKLKEKYDESYDGRS